MERDVPLPNKIAQQAELHRHRQAYTQHTRFLATKLSNALNLYRME